MTIVFIGLGLMGGSLSLALKKAHPHIHRIGIDYKPERNAQVLSLGLADEILPLEQAIQKATGVIMAISVDQIQQQLPQLLNQLPPRVWISDMGSTKQAIVQVVQGHPKRDQFVAAHPIAGTEYSGPSAAFESLYQNKITILCDTHLSQPDMVAQVRDLYLAVGSQIIDMDSVSHDEHIAYVSHLSHITSFALANAVLDKENDVKNIFNLAGSGFASTARLAKSSSDMWIPIFKHNKIHIIKALEDYQLALDDLKLAIVHSDEQKMNELIKKANQIRKILK